MTDGLRLSQPAGRGALAATVLGSGMAMLDGTVVNLALPRIGADLDADFRGLQWVVNGYLLTLAALVLLGGSLGDRLGRRRTFLVGVGWFVAASIACAAAPTIEVLVAARLLQGIGGALLTPGSLAIIQASFHPDERARAIGAWSGLGGVTTAVGPFLGGWLVDAASWRWIFLINVPLGVAVLWFGVRCVPETLDEDAAPHLDLLGTVLAVSGLALLTQGLVTQAAPLVVVGAIGLATFVAAEARVLAPLVPLGIFRSQQFSATNVVTLFLYGALAASMFMVGLVLQEALGYSPLEAGAATLPITIGMLLLSERAGELGRRIGPRLPMTLGPFAMAAGLVLFLRIEPGGTYASAVLPGLLGLTAGLTLTVAPLTATALGSVASRHVGVASGVNNAVARAGGLLAVAVIPVLAGFDAAAAVGPDALVDGFHRVAIWAAGAMALGGALAWAFVRRLEIPDHELPTASDPDPVDGPAGGSG